MGVCEVNALVAAHQSAPTRIGSAPSYPAVRRVLELTADFDRYRLEDAAPRLPTPPPVSAVPRHFVVRDAMSDVPRARFAQSSAVQGILEAPFLRSRITSRLSSEDVEMPIWRRGRGRSGVETLLSALFASLTSRDRIRVLSDII